MDGVFLVSTTSDDRQRLEEIARILVDRHLAACAQISGPITSHYVWEGQPQSSQEWSLTLKTAGEFVPEVEQAILSLHNYDLPEIIWRPVSATQAYLAWVEKQTSKSKSGSDPSDTP